MTDNDVYPVTPAHIAAFGTIVQWFARHEMLMQITVSGIIKSDLDATIMLMEGLGYAGKRSALLSLLKHASLPSDQIEKLRWFMGELQKHNNLRNAIAHNVWVIGQRPKSIKPMRIVVRSGAGKFLGMDDDEPDYTPDDLINISNEIAHLYNQIIDYLGEIGMLTAITENILRTSPDTSSSPGTPSAK